MTNITINRLELGSTLADTKLVELINNGIYTYKDIFEEDEEEVRYTEKGQDEFNEWYDYYCTIIEKCECKGTE